jgi:hypothetical protein
VFLRAANAALVLNFLSPSKQGLGCLEQGLYLPKWHLLQDDGENVTSASCVAWDCAGDKRARCRQARANLSFHFFDCSVICYVLIFQGLCHGE